MTENKHLHRKAFCVDRIFSLSSSLLVFASRSLRTRYLFSSTALRVNFYDLRSEKIRHLNALDCVLGVSEYI